MIHEAEKVDLVKLQLLDISRDCWDSQEPSLLSPIPWAEFSTRFMARYFNAMEREKLQTKFLTLRQDRRTVDEYAAEFCRLSRFTSLMVDTKVKRAKRF